MSDAQHVKPSHCPAMICCLSALTSWFRRVRASRHAVAHAPVACALVFYAVLCPTVLSMPKSPYFDPSVFYAIFYQLSLGRRLYVDIFDNKDPLFFYVYGVFYWLLGVLGPMMCETLIGIGMLLVLNNLMRRMLLSAWMRAFALLFFVVLVYHASVYQALHTYHFSMLLLLLSIECAMAGRVALAGCALALMTAAKMTMVPCCPAVGLYVLVHAMPDSFRSVLRAAAVLVGAYLLTLLLIGAFMFIRGELLGYGDAVRVNMFSAHMVAQWKCPIWATIHQVLTSQLVCMGALLNATSIGILVAAFMKLNSLERASGAQPAAGVEVQQVRQMRAYAVLMVGLPVAVWFALIHTPMKGHHFPPVVMLFSLQCIGLLWYLCRYASRLWTACAMVCLLLTMHAWCRSGLHVQTWSLARWRECIRVQAECEQRVAAIFTRYFGTTNVNYLCIGNCNGVLYAGMTPPHVRLASRLFFQIPVFTPLMSEFDHALTNTATVLLFDGSSGYFTPMPEYQAKVEAVISNNFCRIEPMFGNPLYIRKQVGSQ